MTPAILPMAPGTDACKCEDATLPATVLLSCLPKEEFPSDAETDRAGAEMPPEPNCAASPIAAPLESVLVDLPSFAPGIWLLLCELP